MTKKQQAGQVALIVLLISVVLLTIGLSLVSQSVTDISISKDEEQAMRAFSAAEAGIEEALKQPTFIGWTPSPSPVGSITPNITVTEKTDQSQYVAKGEAIEVILQPTSSNLSITWNNFSAAAIEVSYYNASGVRAREAFYQAGYRPCGGNIRGFTEAVVNPWRLTGFQAGDQKLRVRALCSDTNITVTGLNLPTQRYDIISQAAYGPTTTEGKSSSIEVNRSLPIAPSIFDYVLYSGTNLKIE